MIERSKRIEIAVGYTIDALAFSANGECFVSSQWDEVRVWRGEHCVATMKVHHAECVAMSKDLIAAGTSRGEICVWDASTYKQIFKIRKSEIGICNVDLSPDSTRLVTVSENSHRAAVWDTNTCKQTQSLRHNDVVYIAKYSTRGDRIATATEDLIRVWDSDDDGGLLVNIPVGVAPNYFPGSLVWSNDHILVVSKQGFKELDPSTGSTVSHWAPADRTIRCGVLPKHGKFIAYATNNTVTFWDTFSHSNVAQIRHSGDIGIIAISPDDLSFAICGMNGNLRIDSLFHVIDSTPSLRLHPTLQEPAIKIKLAALDAWQHDQLDRAETLLDTVISTSSIQNHHVLASRALIRAHLARLNDALADAEKSINSQPSVIGYVAKSVAYVGKGDRHKAYSSCDIAIDRFHSDYVTFLLFVKSIIMFLAGDRLDAISRVDDLITVNPLVSVLYVVQAHMLLLHGSTLLECSNYEDAIQCFQRARGQLRPHPPRSLFLISLIFGWKFDNLGITIRQRMCEALYSAGRTTTAADSLIELICTFEKEIYMTESVVKWVSDFAQRCLTTVESNAALDVTRDTDVSLLSEWVKATLVCKTWKDAFAAAIDFGVPRFAVYKAICERLEVIERITEATECALKMASEMSLESVVQVDFVVWLQDKLQEYGDAAMNARRHDEAIVLYSRALSFDFNPSAGLFFKRSKARANVGLWKDAINDANQVILLDPLSPLGYERKYAASRGAGYYGDAELAFKTMLSRMSESPDMEMRERSRRYVKPTETEAAIREAIQAVVRESPLVLINTDTGRLCDKHGQASSFESRPIFHELVSSTTTCIDHRRIQDEVSHYYRYATFSHKWKEGEPSFNDVMQLVVYGLGQSPTHNKLQKFCEMVREAGLLWAWSDTCCINKSDPSVLQEALVSMFQWYQSSSLTIVLLCDVPLRRLFDSIWNSRAWTFQEYHASKVVRFYNKDWTLYKNLDIPNHKESPAIIAEMEEATGISAQALMALRPGLEDIREKLRLASTRQSTRVEDTAYSLLGIFSLSMSIEYGEGDKALGRLLAQLLASSGDTSILAWTGMSGGFNSCLPAKITVFSQSAASHIPATMTSADMKSAIAGLRRGPILASLTKLYDRLSDLEVPYFNGKRLKLPCIVFKLGPLSVSRSRSGRVFRAQTSALGIVEIKASEDLSRFDSLMLVHPWIDFLLERQPVGSVTGTSEGQHPIGGVIEAIPEEGTEDRPSLTSDPSLLSGSDATSVDAETGPSRRFPRLGLFGRRAATRPRDTMSAMQSLRPPSTVLDTDRQMRALRVLARLKQPFGALLLTRDPGNVAAYRRVAAGTLITVQVVEITPVILDKLIRDVDVLDVL